MNYCIELRQIVAITLPPGLSKSNVFVGRVQAVDEHGVRITLIDWITGTFTSHDAYFPWRNIELAMVATEDDDEDLSIEKFAKWQELVNGDRKCMNTPDPA